MREQGRWSRELSKGWSLLYLAWRNVLASPIGGASRESQHQVTGGRAHSPCSRCREPVVAILGKRTQRARQKDRAQAEMEQRELTIYVKARCRRCWRAKRLLRRRSYAFEVIDVSGDDGVRNWLVEATGSKTVPQFFVDGRLVGGLAVVRALDSSGDLERLVRGEV
jgi:glutaredoxin 3